MLSSGFTNAPVTKTLLFGLIGTSIAASLTDSKYLFYIQVVPHLWPYKQLWRIGLWQFCYTNSTELLFASMTLYHMRIIERLWGSRKFASFLAILLPMTAFFPPFLLALVIRPLTFNTINHLPAGPTALIFALLAQYHAAIPHVYKYRIISSTASVTPTSQATPSHAFSFSDKSTTYLLAGQLALSQLPGSLLSAAIGWGLGTAYRNELLPERLVEWRLPGWLVGEKSMHGAGGGFEGLRRRLEGEGRASGVEGDGGAGPGQGPTEGQRQRRGV